MHGHDLRGETICGKEVAQELKVIPFTAIHTIVIKIVLCTEKLPITPFALANYSSKYNNIAFVQQSIKTALAVLANAMKKHPLHS